MGHRGDDQFEASGNSDAIRILKQLQLQMTFLERKVDRLTAMLENKPERGSRHSQSFEKGKRPYQGQGERKFPRGYSKDDDMRSGGHHKEKGISSGKSFGKSFGKPSGKGAGDKKKVFSANKSTGRNLGRRARRDA